MSGEIPRLVTVWCAEWPTVAARLDPEVPAAVMAANRVVSLTPAATAAGVATGMRRRAAQGCCPELVLLDHDPDRDARAFEPVIRAVAEMAPRLEVVEPGWLTLTARGPSRYFGGDAAMAERMASLVRAAVADEARGARAGDDVGVGVGVGADVGAGVGVGVADGRIASAIAARLAARRAERGGSPVAVVPVGGSPAFLTGRTVAWFRELGEASAELVELLVRLGVRTLGDLAALDAGDLTARFGVDGARLHRLATGADARPPDATDPPAEWCVEQAFPEPIEQLETVVFVAKRLADQLADRLADEGRVCVRLLVVAETEHGERSERVWYRDAGLAAPAMVERVRWQLEGWAGQPGGLSGGVALVRLVPAEVRGDDGIPTRLWGGRSRADVDAARAIVRLTALAGEDGVCVPSWAGGRLPDERYRWVPAASVDLDDPTGRLGVGDGPWPGALPAPSPATVHVEPLPAELLDESGALVQVTGRGEPSAPPAVLLVAGRREPIVAWAGPWPIEQRWWHPSVARRLARFQVVTADGVARLVVIERSSWSVLATYT